MEYESRQYCIFSTSELSLIDFSQVLETSADTVRRSVDETLTFVKWNGDQPDCINNLTTIQGIHTHSEMLEILSGTTWAAPMNEEMQ
jgi:hypothetical protein